MSTQQGFMVTVSRPASDGKAARDFGVWAGKTGGESTRTATDYYPGAMLPAIKLTGVPTTSDVVVRKLEASLSDDDVRTLYEDLKDDTQYSAVIQRLTAADRPTGAPKAYRAIVVGVAPSDVAGDSEDAAELTLTLGIFGVPTVAA